MAKKIRDKIRKLERILEMLQKLRAEEIYSEADSLIDSAFNGVQMAIEELKKEETA